MPRNFNAARRAREIRADARRYMVWGLAMAGWDDQRIADRTGYEVSTVRDVRSGLKSLTARNTVLRGVAASRDVDNVMRRDVLLSEGLRQWK